jgi:ribosomal protein L11 methyltransferase
MTTSTGVKPGRSRSSSASRIFLAEFPALDLQWRPGPDVPELVELLHALLDEFEPQAIHDPESGDGWRVFFKTPRQRDAAAAALRASFGDRLAAVSAVDVADEEWARRSQANLTPIRVGRIVVAPPWEVPPPDLRPPDSDLLIVIDPSTGFGTGHHETTRLCLSLLQSLELTARRVIDIGTGSGVLAIAAAKLGASSVVAIDEDPEALRNARENVARNDVAGIVDVREADLASFQCEPAGAVVANLTGAVIQRHAGRLAGLVESGGSLIVSGFTVAEAADVARALGRTAEQKLIEADWAAGTFRI